MPRVASRYGGECYRLPTDFTEMVAAIAPRPFFSNSPVTDFNYNVSGVYVATAALRPVWARYAAASPATTNAGDALHVVFPLGGCLLHTYDLPEVSHECGHDFPDGTRLAAYDFIERSLPEPLDRIVVQP